MKANLILLFLLYFFLNIDAQIGFQNHIITGGPDHVNGAGSVFSADIDGDGDMDIIAGATENDKVIWYENMDGLGTFGEQQIISTETNNVRDIAVADLDGDGDMDVLSASSSDDKIAWYENTDGQGNFSSQKIIYDYAQSVNSIHTADLDGDGDLDVLSTSGIDDLLIWYENTDGLGNFGGPQIISDDLENPNSVYSADLDGDGDMDVLSSASQDREIAWYENTDGQGAFGAKQVITNFVSAALFVLAADIDGDGDMDVLASSQVDEHIVWLENTDGLGGFGGQQLITSIAEGTRSLFTIDIDNDGDIDVLSASSFDDKIAWYENIDGLGAFGNTQVISTEVIDPRAVYAADINGDGAIDILSASSSDDKIVWYENTGVVANQIRGIARVDLGNNGCDDTDIAASNLMITTINGPDDEMGVFTVSNGFYQLFVGEGNHTTSSNVVPFYDVDPISKVSEFIGIGNIDTVDFCLSPNEIINDLNISIYPTSEARPGFEATYRMVYRNIGTTELSGEIMLSYEPAKCTFETASGSINSQTANSIGFLYEELFPFEVRYIDFVFQIFPPPTVNLDDVLEFTTTIDPMAGDNSVLDNTFHLSQEIIGSFDPNDINVLEGSEIELEDVDKYLHYIIRFQNTGTASAIRVQVDNLLDEKLDWSTMQLESASHPNKVLIENGNEVSFIFDDIHLPDSISNEPESHGFIAYKIKPKNDVVLGDIISNQAGIVFDFNEPVITNTVTTEIVEPTSVKDLNQLKFIAQPIPSSGVLNFQAATDIIKIEIYNTLGQLVLMNVKQTSIDLSTLATGTYFCKVTDHQHQSGIKKVIKN